MQFCYRVSKLNVKITQSGVARKEQGCDDEVATVAEGAQARHRHKFKLAHPRQYATVTVLRLGGMTKLRLFLLLSGR